MYKFLVSLLVCCFPTCLQATDYLENTNYVIYNSYSKFSNICIQDDRSTPNTNAYYYSYCQRDTTNLRQEWTFIKSKNDSTQYYIRNVQTKFYLNGSCEPIGNFYRAGQEYTRSNASTWKIKPIKGTDQVEISCQDPYGVSFYLHASDTLYAPATYKDNFMNKNSRFAWRIVAVNKSDSTASAIASPTAESYQVHVTNRQINISGTHNYNIYDANGCDVTYQRQYAPGIYIVRIEKDIIKKIIVK
ncbi:MAG TPA: hypothetical protein DCG33_04185 [Prevotellaceae bacterium]|nr:hypothetical protein [Prevotellaceae bacterium]